MPTLLKDLTPIIRNRLIEPSGTTNPFWSDAELLQIQVLGIKDLWRDIVDLKQEHFCTIDTTHVTLDASATSLSGVPADVHKVYMIEPRDLTTNGTNHGLTFTPLPYNHVSFQLARGRDAIDPTNDVIYYALRGQGSPVGPPTIDIAPKVTSQVTIAFTYIPTLGAMTVDSPVPIPGEADAAIIAWTVAFARAKEREDRSPDPAWLAIYGSEKSHLLESLGLRQYQAPSYADAIWEAYWS